MKSLYTTSAILFIAWTAQAQVTAEPTPPAPSARYDPALDPTMFKKFLDKEFSKLMNPKSNSNLGNFASVDIADAKVAFAGNVNLKRNVLGIKLNGGITEGLMPLFTDAKLNTDVELSFQYNALANARQSLLFTDASHRDYLTKYAAAQHKAELDIIQLRFALRSLQLEASRLAARRAALEQKVDTSLPEADSLSPPPVNKLLNDSLRQEVRKLDQAIAYNGIQQQQAAYPGGVTDVRNGLEAERKKLEAAIAIEGATLRWWSLGYSIKHAAFRLYNPEAGMDSQVAKETFIGHEIRLQYSVYKYTPAINESYYLTASIAPFLGHNLADLTKFEVVEESNSNGVVNRRYSTEKFIAYQGTYLSDRAGVYLRAEAYRFFTKNNKLALHLFPEHRIKQGAAPVTNLGLGLFVAFQDPKEEKTFVNSELYVEGANIFDVGHPDKSFFHRSTAGVRFTFPLTLK